MKPPAPHTTIISDLSIAFYLPHTNKNLAQDTACPNLDAAGNYLVLNFNRITIYCKYNTLRFLAHTFLTKLNEKQQLFQRLRKER
jgi:hypothetical protein